MVDMDGDEIWCDVPPSSYRVAIHHRNHLGVMTASSIALSSIPTTIDFTDPTTATYGTNAQQNINGTMVLWPGDTDFNGTVRYTGAGNDRDVVLQAIGGTVPTNIVSNVYSPNDVNLDGNIMYTGQNNDRDVILQAIGGTAPTAVRTEQLP
jgi:hypothetical protein